MKTLKIRLTALSFTIAMTAFTFTTFASGNKMKAMMDPTYIEEFEEYFDSENFTQELEIKLRPDVRIKVYNQDGKLIASGDVKDEKIKSFIDISDLLTEVHGTKYYKLSYQTTE